MRKILLTITLTLSAAVIGTPLIAPASAGEARHASGAPCQSAPGQASLPAAAIRAALESLGYRVDGVRLDEGCYVARAVNDSGLPIAVRYHPATGDLIRARLRS